MRKWMLLPIGLLIAGTVIIASQMGSDRTNRSVESLSVTVSEGEVELIRNAAKPEKLSAGEGAKMTSSAIVRQNREAADSTHSTSPVLSTPPRIALANPETRPGTLSLRLVDALGDPIETGVIEIQGMDFPFFQGVADIPNMDNGKYNVLVQAEGYSSASLGIDIPMQSPQSVTLEYLMNIDCMVFAEGSNVQRRIPDSGGTEVLLWKGAPAQRPILTTSSMMVDSLSVGKVYTTMGLQDNLIKVLQSDYIDPFDKQEENLMYLAPQTGDSIVGMGDSSLPVDVPPLQEPHRKIAEWNVTNSPRLRIWDSIQAHHEAKLIAMSNPGNLEYVHNNKRQSGAMKTIDPSTKGILITKSVTDSSGKCRFEKLPPGVYFVQARRGNLRSTIIPILPAQGGMNLTLASSSSLVVYVRQDQVKPDGMANIPKATITLRSTDNNRAIFIDTTERMGVSQFEKIPYGEYQVIVEPPRELSLPVKKYQMSIEGGKNWLEVLYDPIQTYSISGRVVRADNRQPIPNILLNLYRSGVPGEIYENGKQGDVSKIFSNADGRFEFKPLTLSDYSLTPLIHKETYVGYVQPYLQVFPKYKYKPETIHLTDKDIQDVEIALSPGVPTLLRGQVVTADGTPVPGAVLTVMKTREPGQTYTEPTDYYGILNDSNLTDDQGHFSLTIVPAAEPSQRTISIQASLFQPTNQTAQASMGGYGMGMGMGGYGSGMGGYGGMGKGMMGTMGVDSRRLAASGSKEVTFSPGEIVSNILITLMDSSNLYSLKGRITTNDGKFPQGVSVYVYQDNESKQGFVSPDGTYLVEWLKPGPFNLQVSVPMYMSNFTKGQDYTAFIRGFNMPTDPKIMIYDIELKRATYLKGKIISKSSQPVSKLVVWVKGENSSGYDESKENGEFWVVGVLPGIAHSIEIKSNEYDPETQKRKSELLTRLEGIVPPQENILIQIP